jgi:hypothetical protein
MLAREFRARVLFSHGVVVLNCLVSCTRIIHDSLGPCEKGRFYSFISMTLRGFKFLSFCNHGELSYGLTVPALSDALMLRSGIIQSVPCTAAVFCSVVRPLPISDH